MYLLCLLDLNMLEAGLPKQWSLESNLEIVFVDLRFLK